MARFMPGIATNPIYQSQRTDRRKSFSYFPLKNPTFPVSWNSKFSEFDKDSTELIIKSFKTKN